MLKCAWFENVYKLVLMGLGLWMISPGYGMASTIPQIRFNWTRTNHRFIEGVGASLSVPERSNLVIRCPTMTDPLEYYIIYWVSAKGFTDCFKPANDSKLLLNCNAPTTSNREFIQEIKSFSGVPGGKDFIVGESYYIATFSTGTEHGIDNDFGGACRENSMKLNLTIVAPTTPGPTNHTSVTTKGPITRTPRPTTRTTRRPTTRPTPTTPKRTTPKPTTPKPHTTGIPVYTDIPVISVPDPGSNGNTGVIDISSSARTCQASWFLVLSLCLSLVHILSYNREYVNR